MSATKDWLQDVKFPDLTDADYAEMRRLDEERKQKAATPPEQLSLPLVMTPNLYVVRGGGQCQGNQPLYVTHYTAGEKFLVLVYYRPHRVVGLQVFGDLKDFDRNGEWEIADRIAGQAFMEGHLMDFKTHQTYMKNHKANDEMLKECLEGFAEVSRLAA